MYSQFRAPPVGLFTQLSRLPPPVLPAWWLVRLLAPPQLQLQCSGLPVLELITTLSVSHQTSPHWEDRSPPLALHWSYKMCLTTLHTLSVLRQLTVLVAVLLLRSILTLVGGSITGSMCNNINHLHSWLCCSSGARYHLISQLQPWVYAQ